MSKTRALAVIAVLIAALLGAGCSSSSDSGSSSSSGDCTTVGSTFTLVAKDLAWKDEAGNKLGCLQAKPGPITFTVKNEDTVQHNLDITGNGVAEKTPLEAGPTTQTLKVDLKAGKYSYVCDIHPSMEGTLNVK